ncbi:hypothetical protein [Celeribacter halophilus]|uniref:hypothetical protein n=1 Tax=Celeribacter halophilus TaxID=576117 RepID=UPI003F53EA24
MWNPSTAPASVQGVFHPSYRGLQSRAAAVLGDQSLTDIKSGGGEFEHNLAKDIVMFGLRNSTDIDVNAPAPLDANRCLHDVEHPIDCGPLSGGCAIGTEGTAPVLVRQVKTRVEEMLEPRLATLPRWRGACASARQCVWDHGSGAIRGGGCLQVRCGEPIAVLGIPYAFCVCGSV